MFYVLHFLFKFCKLKICKNNHAICSTYLPNKRPFFLTICSRIFHWHHLLHEGGFTHGAQSRNIQAKLHFSTPSSPNYLLMTSLSSIKQINTKLNTVVTILLF